MGSKRFPLFVDLTGRAAVVIGGGKVGLRRAEVLRRFGADVTLISPRLCAPLEGVRHIPRPYQPGDLAGAFLAVAAADSGAVNAAAGREARERGVMYNLSECPAECDFFVPAGCVGAGLGAASAGDGSDHRRTAEAARKIRQIIREI